MIERKFFPEDAASPARFLILPIWLLATVAVGTVLNVSSTICLWIVCSFFLFVLLDPAAEYLKRRKWPTAIAALFLILVSTALMVVMLYCLGHLLAQMWVELDKSRQVFIKALKSLNLLWSSWTAGVPSLNAATGTADVTKVELVTSSPLGGEWSDKILHGMGSVASIITFAILTPILSFFMLAERDSLARIIQRAYFNQSAAQTSWHKIIRSTRAFFVGNFLLGVITFPFFALLFWFFSVPSFFTVAALATFFNLIPFAGAVLSGFLPAIALYGANPTLGAPLAVYGACVVIHFIIADFITPKVLGSQVNINATTSTIALVVWGEFWGGMGLILAIPLTSLIKILFEHSSFFWLQWIAGLMSEDADGALQPSLKKKLNAKNSKDA